MDRIEAYFAQGVNELEIKGLTQHDKDVLLHISGDDIPDFFELHMDYYGRKSAMRFQLNKVDGVATIKIPNELLKQRKTFRAWVYVIGSEGCRTKKTIILPLIPRNKADDIVSGMEEKQKDSVEQLIEASNKLVKSASESIQTLEENADLTESAKQLVESMGYLEADVDAILETQEALSGGDSE